MTSPTKPFAQLKVSKTRTRGDMISLLPSSYDSSINVMPESPAPEVNPCLYTVERLQQSLVYAHKFLARRNISPRSELFMHLYKEELKDALNAETHEERERCVTMVMAEERLIQDKRFLRPLKSEQSAELEDQLLRLRELQYYVRYGDYLKIIPTRLKLHASKDKLENWQLLSGNNYWSDIAQNLKIEEETQQEIIRKGSVLDPVRLDTTIAISTACSDLGISKELAVWSIMEYGARNLQVHRDLVDLRKEGKFPLLAKILCADRNELSSTFSEFKSETNLSFLRTIIQTEIDTWFDTSDNPDHPDEWVPTTALRQFRKDALEKASKPSKKELKQANIAKAQKLSEEKAARQNEGSRADSSTAGKKRIASTEEPRGSEEERRERTTRQRFRSLAKKCKLEEELKRINSELAIIDKDDCLLNVSPADNH